MATLTIALTGSAVVTGSKSWTVSDADVQNWVNCLIAAQSTFGKTVPNAQQALVAWANSIVAAQILQTQQFMKGQQIKALAVPPPIVFT